MNGVRNGEALLEDLKGIAKSFFYDSKGNEVAQERKPAEVEILGGKRKQTKHKGRKNKNKTRKITIF